MPAAGSARGPPGLGSSPTWIGFAAADAHHPLTCCDVAAADAGDVAAAVAAAAADSIVDAGSLPQENCPSAQSDAGSCRIHEVAGLRKRKYVKIVIIKFKHCYYLGTAIEQHFCRKKVINL